MPQSEKEVFFMVLRGVIRSLGLFMMLALFSPALAEGPASSRDLLDIDQTVAPDVANQIATLTSLLQVPQILEVMQQEGIDYGSSLENDMFAGEGGGPWAASVAMIYDVAQTKTRFDQAFVAALGKDPETLAAGLRFFGSPLGQRIVGLEVSTRRAMLDPSAEQAAETAFAAMKVTSSPRIGALERFAKANDLIESNVMGALNANLAFYQGLSIGGGLEDGMTTQDMVAQVWEQESSVRLETTDWLYPFMLTAYQPLTDAEFAEYITFSETLAGRKLNTVLFQAFEAVYTDVSKNLGLAVARQLQGDDI